MTNEPISATGITVPSIGFNSPQPVEFKSEVDAKALQALFDRDPEQLTKEDLTTIVVELRKQRAKFSVDEQAKAMQEKKPRAKVTKVLSADESKQLSLGDLGL